MEDRKDTEERPAEMRRYKLETELTKDGVLTYPKVPKPWIVDVKLADEM
jgi:hypothetical protein